MESTVSDLLIVRKITRTKTTMKKEIKMAVTQEKADALFNLMVQGVYPLAPRVTSVQIVMYPASVHIDGEVLYEIASTLIRSEEFDV
jgi:hypothetical protein